MQESPKSARSSEVLEREYGKDLETRRWFILFSFGLFSASNAMIWISYSPITSTAEKYYHVDTKDIIQFSNAYMYIYFIFSFLFLLQGSWLAYKWFTLSLLGAMILNVSGAWIRYLALDSFVPALIGQYVAALAQNLILFMPVLIAERWFSRSERAWAITIGALSNFVGWGFGFVFPTIVVSDGIDRVHSLLFYEAATATVPLIIGIFAIQDKPRIAPSYSAFVKLHDTASFKDELLSLLKNLKYVVASICFANIIGQSYTLSTVIVLFIPDVPLSEQGFLGIVFIGCGILGGIVGTSLLTLFSKVKYDAIIKSYAAISIIALLILSLIVHQQKIISIYVLMGFLGVSLMGIQPFAAQSVVDMTFPAQESISYNTVMMLSQLFGLIGNSLSTADFIGSEGLWSLVGLIAPCAIYLTFFHKTERKQEEAEEKHKSFSSLYEEI